MLTENRKSTSDSLINMFVDGNTGGGGGAGAGAGVVRASDDDGIINRRKTVESVVTVEESMSMSTMGGDQNSLGSHNDDFMFKMTKQEYLESIFGPSLNAKSLSERKTLRQKIRFVLMSNYLNVAVIVLVLLDSFCVTIELIIDLENGEKSEGLMIAAEFFKYLGFAIISLFVVEITVKIAVLGKEFFKSKLEVIDGIIVYVSFALELAFMNDEGLSALVGLITLFRFWRIIRIVNGIVVSVERRTETKMEKLKHGMNALIKETQSLKEKLNQKQALLDDIFVAYSI